MGQIYLLYNPLAGDASVVAGRLESLKAHIGQQPFTEVDVTALHSYADFFECLTSEDVVYLCGGDGTIHRLINGMCGTRLPCRLYYYCSGTGNDFLRDLGHSPDGEPIAMNLYLEKLPRVTVKERTYRFLNNASFGIDGYCTEVGDTLKAAKKPVNYTTIALKGLFIGFRPTHAQVTVDGQTISHKKVWMAATMNGRYLGGGMMAAPGQNRMDPEGKVSLMVVHDAGRLRLLTLFPTLFKGTHIRYQKYVSIYRGHDISVTFDEPRPMQLDGETIHDVLTYHVQSDQAAQQADAQNTPICVG